MITAVANDPIEPDARLPNPKRVCEGLPISLVEIDVEIQPLLPQTQLTLWDDPIVNDPLTQATLDSTEDEAKDFTVGEGPVCYDNQIWWQVSNGTLTGWLPEHHRLPEDNYSILPSDLVELWQINPPSPLQFLDFGSFPD